MAKFAPWSDLFKFSTDVLEEDYIFDKNFQIKAKTKNGNDESSLKFEQTKPDEGVSSNSTELKHKHSCKDCSWEGKIKNGGKVSIELEQNLQSLNEQFKGWSYVLSGNLQSGLNLDKASFTSSLKYKRDFLESKVTADHAKKGKEIQVEATLKATEDGQTIIGGSSTFDFASKKVLKYSLGFATKCSDKFSVGGQLLCDDGVNFGHFKFYSQRTISDSLKFATNVSYNNKNIDATVGFHHSCSSGKQLKGKVTTGGLFALSAKYDIGNGLNLLWSTGFDLALKRHAHANPHPFGVGIDYKF